MGSSFKQSGISLVELMVALAVSSVLILSVTKVFDMQKKVVEKTAALNRMHSNTQFLLRTFSRLVSMAGYFPNYDLHGARKNIHPLSSFPGNCDSDWVFDLDESLRGYEGAANISGLHGLPKGCIASNYVTESDLLLVKFADPERNYLDSELDNTENKRRYFYRTGAWGIPHIFDGAHSEEALQHLPLNSTVSNRKVQAALLYLAHCNHKDCHRQGHVLMQLALEGNRLVKRELLCGIEQLQLEYGFDSNDDGTVDRYLSASQVNTDWKNVRSVKVFALMYEKISGIAKDQTTFRLGTRPSGSLNYSIPHNDRQSSRRAFVFEIARRNAGAGAPKSE